MKRKMQFVLALALAGAMAGCGQNWQRQQLEKTVVQARTSVQKGDVDTAVRLLEAAFAKSAYQQWQPELLTEIVLAQVAGGRLEAAKDRAFAAAAKNPDVARSALGVVASSLDQQQKYDALAQWCKRLAALKLSDAMLTEVAVWHANAVRNAHIDETLTVVKSYLPRLSAGGSQGLVDNVCQAMIQAGQHAAAAQLLDYVDQSLSQSPDWRTLGIRLRIELLLAQSRWPEATQYFEQTAASLSDPQLSDVLHRLLNKTMIANRGEFADKACMFVLNEVQDKPGCRDLAAQWAVRFPVNRGDIALAMQRLTSLVGMGFGLPLILDCTDVVYPLVMEKGSIPQVQVFVTHCESLLPLVTMDSQKASLTGMMLDGSFRADRFDTMLKLLEAGIPGQNAQWHKMMINKVKAHQAMKEGRKQEAVDRFRTFMNDLRSLAADQTDPVTGNRVSKEAILGLNEKRIADILASMGQTQEAHAAYKEALTYYQQALAKEPKGSDESKELQQAISKIPGAAK